MPKKLKLKEAKKNEFKSYFDHFVTELCLIPLNVLFSGDDHKHRDGTPV